MTALVWDDIGNRFYESGLDHGVLYLPGQPGVVWNGLISVDEIMSDTTTPHFIDGVKYMNHESLSEYSAKLKAFTYPNEFEKCLMANEVSLGLFAHDQKLTNFGLSYRTNIANDTDISGYQIHVIYNATVVPEVIVRNTIDDKVDISEFSWTISTVPDQSMPGFRPTAHVIFDSTETDPLFLADIENLLYGSGSSPPTLPSLRLLVNLGIVIITDNSDGTWSATGPDRLIRLLDPTTFEIDGNAVYLDANTYTISDTL